MSSRAALWLDFPQNSLKSNVFLLGLAKTETEMLYYWRMKKWESLQQAAFESYGIITFAQAMNLGIFPAEIYRWRKKGRLMKVGRGVFRLTSYPSQGFLSDMAALLSLLGKGAYLHGESALALYGLCPVRSYVASVAVQGRFRKRLIPEGVNIVHSPPGYHPIHHDGIACQRPEDAIRSCIGVLERDRLMEAVDEAEDKGLLLVKEAEILRKMVADGKAAAQ